MTVVFTGDESIGAIVGEFHGASNLLKEHRIDFCCGGDRTLNTVLKQKGIETDSFVKKLNAMAALAVEAPAGTDWRTAPLTELVGHIIRKHHDYLRAELPVLGEFVAKVARVHGANHPELIRLHHYYQELRTDLEEHLAAEERETFPLIAEYESVQTREALAQALATINRLEDEHSRAGELLGDMRLVTHDYMLPPDACRTYTLAFRKLEDLEADMFEHIHLENNILFTRLAAMAAR
ncbi:iron-sulfur cluster repair di-iron protein [Paenibacillus sambharensis]|uniref:Iron-sulfur cluster repair di-iron protein n=1 Tax=Paenibacillus sambharensis TaxID=1803190 RepID=A0A2W1L8L1_9BACL|nr:iron-sulfur cluster repair di-iron protein [Paenibacillus sambharensis]PZD95586.1 iron-sulfur cluster repair di-iron protein [Paenibacillus sambharensis]